jgi:hypothetical protein
MIIIFIIIKMLTLPPTKIEIIENVKNMLGSAVERKPKVEQVNVTGGRLLREAKVRSAITSLPSIISLSPSLSWKINTKR